MARLLFRCSRREIVVVVFGIEVHLWVDPSGPSGPSGPCGLSGGSGRHGGGKR